MKKIMKKITKLYTQVVAMVTKFTRGFIKLSTVLMCFYFMLTLWDSVLTANLIGVIFRCITILLLIYVNREVG